MLHPGLNANDAGMPLALELSFAWKAKGTLITGGEGERAFSPAPVKGGQHKISIKAHGGNVAVFK